MNLILDWLSGMDTFQRCWRIAILAGALLLSGCNSSKFLTDGEAILTKQSVELLDSKKVESRGDLAYELTTLAQQTPNTDFLFLFPREHFYLANSKPKDSTWVDRVLRNGIGQPPTIYSDSLSRASAERMQSYLQYQGYFNAEVYHEPDRRKHKVRLKYFATPGPRTRIKSVQYNSNQADIDSLLVEAKAASLLQPGEPLDLNVYQQEQERISRFLRNKGYAFLYNNAFDQLEVDTFGNDGLADIYLRILPPRQGGNHIRYRIGRVDVYADYSLTDSEGGLLDADKGYPLDTIIDNVRFRYRKPRSGVDPNALLNNLFLRPDEYYSKENFDKSNQQLGGLGIFRFVRINQVPDSLDETILHYVIQLTPNDKMEFGVNLDFNFTNRSATDFNNLIGIGLNPSFKNRNLLGGAQLFVSNLRGGIEIDPIVGGESDRFFNTIDLGADFSLYLPRFKDVTGVYRLLYGKGKRLLSDRFYQAIKEKAETRISLGAEYLQILDYYAYTQVNARLGYDFSISPTTRYQFNHAAIDLLTPTTDSLFEDILLENPFLQESFGEQYFVSLLFRDVNYTRTGRANFRGQSLTFNANFETAGWELYGVNQLVNAVSSRSRTFKPTSDGEYAQYARLRLDTRFNQKYSELTSFASRFVLGYAAPFGNSRAVPYVKQFSVGGANSMRAWAPRGLGPGGFLDSISLDRSLSNNLLLYQTGDLMLELNLEYRFKIYSFFRGAFFLDIGNVWTRELEDGEEARCGSQFRFSKTSYPCNDKMFHHQPFYRQLAVGAGTGLRVDLSYFIFRLDASVPLRFNYPRERPEVADIPERLYWNDFADFSFFRSISWQLGLGYPF